MTISEIAKLAGVSNAAVSRYLNDGYLSQEKREAIAKAIKETGYRPSPQAQTLRTHRSKMVGVILPRIESNSIARVVAGISGVMNKKKFKIIMANTENNPDTELRYMKVFDDKQVDGLIFVATVITDRHRKMIAKSTIPIVVVGQKVDETDCIYHDDYHATYELVEHMVERGRRHPAYIAVLEEDRAVGHDRTKGYRDAVAAHGLQEMADHIVTADFSMGSGMAEMAKILSLYPETDAVIAATDTIAVGALRAIRERGLRVPEDVMIAGIGNSPISEVTLPMLTTMNYEYEESGRQAAELLLDRISGKASGEGAADAGADGRESHSSVVLGHQLIVRESTGM